jgi:hypothetical protein
MSFQFSDNHGDPLKEGDAFRHLIATVNPEMVFPESTAGYQSELDRVFDWVADSNEKRSLPYVNGFLSKILVPGGIRSNIIEIFGVDEVVSMQDEIAPICNIRKGSGIIQFGSWTGDYSDGDAWCIDLRASEIICIPVGSGYEDRDQTRAAAYGVLPNFSYFVSFLASSVLQRGWLDTYLLRRQ